MTELNWSGITLLGIAVLGWMRASYWKKETNRALHKLHIWAHPWPDGTPNPNCGTHAVDYYNCVWCADPDQPSDGQFPRRPLAYWAARPSDPWHWERSARGSLRWVRGKRPVD